ncbi:phage tail length tape measure family protein [Mucilaginibacter sp. 10I4]|uniref:phage tail length tape measure family protein n=1 Tax=Mucilaginibacter sp. 10I4 TaxID=3048580 RepID=UPI002B23E98D|nr:phage tail length tape measure family protein [Mucilaginibacter sp. 10I4]MEB0262299.1 phage tail length tape measure family protein [Mucilaginibacter sp. 10I4]
MPESVKYEMSLNDLVSPKLDTAEKHAQKFESRLGSLQSGLGKLGEKALAIGTTLGISFAFIKLEEFVHAGVEAAHTLAQAEAQVKAGLISTNQAAGVSYEDLEASAKRFSATLPYSRAQIMDMQAQLVTFPGVTKKTFDSASQAIMDMSTRLHKGLDETAIMVGKALQDPEKGITAMRRVGVNFNQTQTEIIKKLVETGHAGKAQTMILGELQNEFAGSAKAAADADPLFRYNKLMGSIKVSIGLAAEGLLHDLTPALEFAAGSAKAAYETMAGWMDYLKDNAGPILKEIKNDAIALGVGIGVATTAFVIANPQVLVYTGALILNGIASAGLAVVTGVLTAAQWLLNAAMTANPIGIIVVAIGALAAGLVLAYQKSETFRAVLSGIGEVAKDIGGIFKGLGDQILGAMTFNPDLVMKGFSEMASSFHDIGSAFHRGYTQSIAESEKEKNESTLGKTQHEAKTKPGTVKPSAVGKSTASSKVTGSKVLNINIHIGALIKEMRIQTSTFKEGVNKAQSMVTEAMLSAVNDSQLSAGS